MSAWRLCTRRSHGPPTASALGSGAGRGWSRERVLGGGVSDGGGGLFFFLRLRPRGVFLSLGRLHHHHLVSEDLSRGGQRGGDGGDVLELDVGHAFAGGGVPVVDDAHARSPRQPWRKTGRSRARQPWWRGCTRTPCGCRARAPRARGAASRARAPRDDACAQPRAPRWWRDRDRGRGRGRGRDRGGTGDGRGRGRAGPSSGRDGPSSGRDGRDGATVARVVAATGRAVARGAVATVSAVTLVGRGRRDRAWRVGILRSRRLLGVRARFVVGGAHRERRIGGRGTRECRSTEDSARISCDVRTTCPDRGGARGKMVTGAIRRESETSRRGKLLLRRQALVVCNFPVVARVSPPHPRGPWRSRTASRAAPPPPRVSPRPRDARSRLGISPRRVAR